MMYHSDTIKTIEIKFFLICIILLFFQSLTYSQNHTLLQDSINVKKSNYELKIELPKYIYKEYEPVIDNIQLINHDSKPLNLWGTFEPIYRVTRVIVTDEKGQRWSKDWVPPVITFAFNGPTQVIQPGDTLFIAMSINDHGVAQAEYITLELTHIYFGNFGYFIPGRYKAYFDVDLNYYWENNVETGRLISNEVKFKVNASDSIDELILKVYRENKYDNWKVFKNLI